MHVSIWSISSCSQIKNQKDRIIYVTGRVGPQVDLRALMFLVAIAAPVVHMSS